MATDWRPTFRAIPARLRDALPADLHGFEWTATSWMAKAWYGNRALHYEIWVRHRARLVEIGLHFEADALTNARLLAAFHARAKDVKRGLGAAARIEEWDKGWTRVWEPFALAAPDVADRVTARFCDYVRVLEPILRDEVPSDVDWVLRMTPARTTRRRPAISSRASR